MRIFGGGCYERNTSVLYIFQQCLLLLSIEILYLVYIQKYATRTEHVVCSGQYLLYVGQRCCGGVDTVEYHIGVFGYYLRGWGLAGAGRAVKYHIGESSRSYHSANDSSFSEKMILTDYVIKAFRSYCICSSDVIHSGSFSFH